MSSRRSTESAARPDVHGYAPFSGLPALKEAIAARYREVYGVAPRPAREVAVLPGTKTGLMEFALCTVESGGTIVLPDPGYPDYFSAVALAGAASVPSLRGLRRRAADAMYLNFPSNPTAATCPTVVFEEAVQWAERNEAWVLHDFAYGDLVFDGRTPTELPRGGRSTRRRRRAVQHVEDATAWPGGGSASPSETRSSFAGSSCYRTTPSPGSSGRCRRRESRR